ncbi:aminodeoxychorismate/anthranilate synthase component II [Parvularcula sp. LCG005]|uniref:anthranilate synthase component II n=1 Tax=Parvularcula sp. LCG005 TaxID=3078805 RepID=UPI0029434E22|nr:aminodeoxychorismate/anthranilate synthase component II [Parvularcula sp. LCG005]WOI52082.1 aminodeoxychorismate/anthranilate synthase component II [Parvularcula sp. LCG005]
MILVIDNYDSFTYNLVHLIGGVDPNIVVKRNDALSAEEALAMAPDAIVLSPGPCSPNEAGICLPVATAAYERSIPLLGVCLGHQTIAQAAGGKVVRAKRLMHGRTSEVTHDDSDRFFENVPRTFTATRYHSLVAEQLQLPNTLKILARADDDDEIMAVRWGDAPIWGVQFHPESIASQFGAQMIENFLLAAKEAKAAA